MMASLQANEYVFVAINGFICGILCVLGLVGHCLSLPVLWRRDGARMSNTTLCLFVCGIYSSLFLLTNVMITSLHWVTYGIDQKSMLLHKFTIPARAVGDQINWVVITGFVFTTVLMCLDRCVDLVKPELWTRVFSGIRFRITLVLLPILSVILNIPQYFTEEYYSKFDPMFNRTFTASVLTDYATSFFHENVYRQGFVNVYLVFGPMLIVLLCCVVLVAEAVVWTYRQRQYDRHISALSTLTKSIPSRRPTAVTRGIPSGHVFVCIDFKRETSQSLQANISTTCISTVSQATPPYSRIEKNGGHKGNKKRPSRLSLGVSSITAVVFIIGMTTIINRIMLALCVFYCDCEECLVYSGVHVSTLCAWWTALRHLLLVVNMSWNFVLFLAFDGKFRAGFAMTCRPRMMRRQMIGASFVMENKAFVPDVENEEEKTASDVDSKGDKTQPQHESKTEETEKPQRQKLYCLYAPEIDVYAEIPPADEYMI